MADEIRRCQGCRDLIIRSHKGQPWRSLVDQGKFCTAGGGRAPHLPDAAVIAESTADERRKTISAKRLGDLTWQDWAWIALGVLVIAWVLLQLLL
jgi:hypothetical protein